MGGANTKEADEEPPPVSGVQVLIRFRRLAEMFKAALVTLTSFCRSQQA